jgi:hypothetical protein
MFAKNPIPAEFFEILTMVMGNIKNIQILTKGGYLTPNLQVLSYNSNMVFVRISDQLNNKDAFFLISEIASIVIYDNP